MMVDDKNNAQELNFKVLPEKVLWALKNNIQWRKMGLILSFVAIPLSLAIIWYAWVKVLPLLWGWSFGELSLKNIPGAVAVLCLAVLPVVLPAFTVSTFLQILESYAEAEATKTTEAMLQGSSEQERVEEELKEIDKSGLVLLLRYSRVQLEGYYAIGLNQTQLSFLYSVIAMWIGFTVILAGIIIPIFKLSADSNVSVLAIVSGIIIEVISALFLWVYRSSIRQLTYFYDRQMYNHSILMCHRIAETMQSPDEVKKTIAEKVLDKAWVLQQEALPQAERLLQFGSKKQ